MYKGLNAKFLQKIFKQTSDGLLAIKTKLLNYKLVIISSRTKSDQLEEILFYLINKDQVH